MGNMAVVSTGLRGRLPVVVVLGATGTGKSKLALEIAGRFKGEIISADSMQVYRGLDIVTNKVTPEEQAQVPHHILDFLDPLSRYSVTDFRNAALPVVEQLIRENKMPVIVGGTNYYIESLLWKVLIDSVPKQGDGRKLVYERDKELYGGVEKRSSDTEGEQCSLKKSRVGDGGGGEGNGSGSYDSAKSDENSVDKVQSNKVNNYESRKPKCNINNNINDNNSGGGGGLSVWQDTDISTEDLYQRLQEVDPDMAATYHPNERRKIIRSLQVWEQTGQPHSQLLEKQKQQEGGSGLGGALRFPHSVIFWLTCDQEVLLDRLDARVDQMIERGLLKELLDFHTSYNSQRLKEDQPTDYTKGIFQSIGFKEFHEFLVLPEEEREGEKGRKLYQAGVAAMKLATRQYTKKQLRWIKNRFLTPSDRKVPAVYTLDGTDPEQWDTCVRAPAEAVVEAVIEGRVPDLQPANTQQNGNSKPHSNKTRYECDVCQRVFIGDHIWQGHLKGAKHRKMVRRKGLSREAARAES